MSYWDYEEPIWEPSEADELFDELKSKLVDAAKASLKNDMESLKSRNEYLEKREQLNYDKHIGFTSKEECQKYCDWLNKQKKMRRTNNDF